jgi:hypothetical protein
MQEYLAAMERLRKDAAKAELIRDLATEKDKSIAPSFKSPCGRN